jgi:hypothetical protein
MMAQEIIITAGNAIDARQAASSVKPASTMGLKSTEIMKICVAPPPVEF